MNKRSLRILEYNKILDTLATYAVSSGAKRKVYKLSPSTDIVKIEELQQNTRDAFIRLEKAGNVSFAGVHDVMGFAKVLGIGSSLSAAELLDIAGLLEAAFAVKNYGDGVEEKDSLTPLFDELVPLQDISSEIRRCIITSEDIADDASSTLRSIRRQILETNTSIHNQLDRIVKSQNNQEKLMDALVTMRNGRYCIPVRVEHKNAFPGMVHDRSQTGATIFIEPMEVVNLNNKIQELQSDEKAEIEKILEDLSRMAGSALDEIIEDYKTLVELDFVFAKAKYAKAIDATEPIFNEDGIVDLKRAIHPLLDKKTAVPIDLRIGEDYTLLIVTGPNTGGKTVSLKTLGLFTLMGQSGLHIPAMSESRLAVFTDVFADIGDEQSIEQNLSTFSSHMSNIVYIVKHADDKSLCLFDEPGGGTDPTEGAALAIAIMESLKNRGARVMATTHYTELKTYALGTEGVENASSEFDTKTLRPTYRLMIGVPGSSNAFAIAKRLGMPEDITEKARGSMDESQLSMEKIIKELEEMRRAAEKDRREIFELKAAEARLKQSLTDKEKNLDKKKDAILKEAKEEAKLIIADAKETADQAIRDYNKWLKNPNKADVRDMENRRTSLRKKADGYGDGKKKDKKKQESGHTAKDFKIGDRVMVLSLETEGSVVSEADSKGMIEVLMGIFTSRFPASDLLILEEKKEKKQKAYRYAGTSGESSIAYTFKPEINLLGKTVDEAVAELDKFLDDALLTHTETVRIVHGKGTGALRKGVTEYLKKQRFVKSFRSGEFGEGDSGVTVVKL